MRYPSFLLGVVLFAGLPLSGKCWSIRQAIPELVISPLCYVKADVPHTVLVFFPIYPAIVTSAGWAVSLRDSELPPTRVTRLSTQWVNGATNNLRQYTSATGG